MKNRRWDAILSRLKKDEEIKVAEIGVWTGLLSKYLLKYRPLMQLYMIDRWSTYTDEEKAGDESGKMTYYDQEVFDNAEKTAMSETEKYKDRRIVIKSDSAKAADQVKDNSLDLVFIDADHSYEGVKKDIQAWLPKVKDNGWIGGHDYTRRGVEKAVSEFFNEIETDVDKTWFVRKSNTKGE